MRRIAAPASVAFLTLLLGCTNEAAYHPAPGQKMHVTQHVIDGFHRYQALIGSTRDGAFAVSSGGNGYYYRYCPDLGCSNSGATANEALAKCQKYGDKCYIFARNNDIKVDYDIVP